MYFFCIRNNSRALLSILSLANIDFNFQTEAKSHTIHCRYYRLKSVACKTSGIADSSIPASPAHPLCFSSCAEPKTWLLLPNPRNCKISLKPYDGRNQYCRTKTKRKVITSIYFHNTYKVSSFWANQIGERSYRKVKRPILVVCGATTFVEVVLIY
jgi:hypothetical protein